jgi:hypothetical protein
VLHHPGLVCVLDDRLREAAQEALAKFPHDVRYLRQAHRCGAHVLLHGVEPTVKGGVQALASSIPVVICTSVIERDNLSESPRAGLLDTGLREYSPYISERPPLGHNIYRMLPFRGFFVG